MALVDTTVGVNKLLDDLGLGKLWNLAQGSFSTPFGDTITFYDVSSSLGLRTNIPLAGEVINAVKQQRLGGFDGSGSTFYIQDGFSGRNEILSYKLPDGKEALRQWGSRRTSITVVMLLCNAGYIPKIQKCVEIFSTDLGMNGGILQHPIFGSLPNTFVESYDCLTGQDVFNGTLCVIKFSSPNLFNISSTTQLPFIEQCQNVVSSLNDNLAAIASLPDVQDQLKAIVTNPLFTSQSGTSIIGSAIVDSYNTNVGVPSGYNQPSLVSVSEPIIAINQQLATASDQLTANGLSIDFDISYQAQVITEVLCQIGGITVGNYGNGGLSNSTTSTEVITAEQAITLVRTEQYVNIYGQLVQINRQIQSINGDLYTILITTTITTPIIGSNSFVYIKSLINQVVVACNVYSIIYPDYYIVYAQIISDLEVFYSLILQANGNTWTVPYGMSLFMASEITGVSTLKLLKNNLNLIGHRPLIKGMVLYL